MRLTSVRARLTLWNVSIMALALLVFAAAVRLIVQHDVSASIDRDLADNGAWLASRWSYQANRFLPRPGLMPAPPMQASSENSVT